MKKLTFILTLLLPFQLFGASVMGTPVARSVPFDNSTNGFVSTDVQSAIEEATHTVTAAEITSAGTNTTTSGTDAQMTGMTTTPAAGTYLVMFNTDIVSSNAGATVTVSYYVGGVQLATSVRKISPFDGGTLSALTARGMATLQAIITVTGSQAITVEWSTTGGTATSAERSLVTVRTK